MCSPRGAGPSGAPEAVMGLGAPQEACRPVGGNGAGAGAGGADECAGRAHVPECGRCGEGDRPAVAPVAVFLVHAHRFEQPRSSPAGRPHRHRRSGTAYRFRPGTPVPSTPRARRTRSPLDAMLRNEPTRPGRRDRGGAEGGGAPAVRRARLSRYEDHRHHAGGGARHRLVLRPLPGQGRPAPGPDGDLNAQLEAEIGAHDDGTGHDLTDPGQLRARLAVTWGVIRDHLPVIVALMQTSFAAPPREGRVWASLAGDTGVFREHLAWLRERGHPLPGGPAVVAAAMGAMVSCSGSRRRPRAGAPRHLRRRDHRHADAPVAARARRPGVGRLSGRGGARPGVPSDAGTGSVPASLRTPSGRAASRCPPGSAARRRPRGRPRRCRPRTSGPRRWRRRGPCRRGRPIR